MTPAQLRYIYMSSRRHRIDNGVKSAQLLRLSLVVTFSITDLDHTIAPIFDAGLPNSAWMGGWVSEGVSG